MAIFFVEKQDNYEPLFKNTQVIDIKIAIVFAKRLSESVEALPGKDYKNIPHAISCIYFEDTDFFIDTQHQTIDEEEEKLSPPEKDEDGWRSSSQRLIYLIVQIFYSLAVGRLPSSEIKFLPSKMLCNLSESNMILIKEFLTYGLALDKKKRYQTFKEFSEVIDIIIKRLATQNTTRIVTTKVKNRFSYASQLKLYNFKSSLTTMVNIYAPCRVLIGRILDIEDKKFIKKTDVATIYQNFFSEEQIPEYYIVIENDNCISRKHLQVYMDKELKKSFIQDLGSTHGTIIFADSSCEITSGMAIQGSKMSFIIPFDQYFQIGNTQINISTSKKLH
ncbi:FHA domain-containing protein [Candidatus Uabimicrobium sp. HlEnr_7]|uniref:FHA domain-containing protein n=1 Tax=Candidatus Uabimicrobium helgolandensis TaxID=3095367 RepID=UPI003557310B